MARRAFGVLTVALLAVSGGAKAQWVQPLKSPTCLAFSPDGRTLAAGAIEDWASPGDLRVWDVASGRLLHRERYVQGVEALAFSPDGRTLAVATDSPSGDIRLWNLRTWHVDRAIGDQYISSLAYSPDGARILAGSNMGENGETDSAYFYGLRTGKKRKMPESDGLSRMLFAPRGGLILGAFYSGYYNDDSENLRAWDASGRLLWRRPLRDLRGVAFRPDGRAFLAGTSVSGEDDEGSKARGGSLQVRDARSGRLLRSMPYARGVNSLSASRDGAVWATGDSAGAVSLWDARAYRVFKTMSLHSKGIRALAFSPDGRHIASAGGDDRVRLSKVPRLN